MRDACKDIVVKNYITRCRNDTTYRAIVVAARP